MKQSNQMKKTALYCRLSQDDGLEGESYSIQNHDVMYRGWNTPKKHYIMTGGSFVANEKTVMIKEECPQTYRNCQPHSRERSLVRLTTLTRWRSLRTEYSPVYLFLLLLRYS